MSDLIVFENLPPPAVVFAGGGARSIIERIKAECRAHVPDISTKKGREEIASIAYKISKAKTALDAMGKSVIEEAQATVNAVNAERKTIRDELDQFKEEFRAPLTAWEQKEQDRIDDLENAIHLIDAKINYPADYTADQLAEYINAVKQHDESFDWQEFAERANRIRKYVVDTLEAELESKRKYEADQAELRRLREEEQKRQQQARDDEIARQAANQARLEAEQKAERERKAAEQKIDQERRAAEAERNRIEQEKQAAIDKAAQAERGRIAAEQKAIDDAKIAADRAEQDKQAAIQRERDRIAREQKAEQDAIAKREADKAHRIKIHSEVVSALRNLDVSLSNEQARAIGIAIAEGKIPHVKISY